jgi:hypothetical protein
MTAPQRDVATITAMLNLIETPAIRTKIEAALKDEAIDKVITAEKAGQVLGCSNRTIHTLANEGHLRRVRFPGRSQGSGFLESDVRTLLAISVSGGSQ